MALGLSQLPPSSKSFQEAQSELNQAAADLNQSAGEVVHATRGQSGELAAASGKFSDDFDEFLDAGIEMAGQAQVSFLSCKFGARIILGIDSCSAVSSLSSSTVQCASVSLSKYDR